MADKLDEYRKKRRRGAGRERRRRIVSGERSEREIHGRTIELSNLDKVFFPDEGLTKGDVVSYYERIAETMLPHVRDRFLSMERFPDGIAGEGFYQKETPDYFPDWIRTEEVEKEGGTNCQVVVEEPATLVYLAQQATLTLHAWPSRADKPRHPDRLVFDFDPPGDDWEGAFPEVRRAARQLRDLLEDLGLTPYVMTSGSKGLHVHVPLDRSADFSTVKAVARRVSELLVAREPDRLTTEVRKKKRSGRVFIDYLRNEYAQTAVAPYSLRARPGAPVATPLAWDELSRDGMGPRRYTLRNLSRRLAQTEDPWRDLDGHAAAADDDLVERLDSAVKEASDT